MLFCSLIIRMLCLVLLNSVLLMTLYCSFFSSDVMSREVRSDSSTYRLAVTGFIQVARRLSVSLTSPSPSEEAGHIYIYIYIHTHTHTLERERERESCVKVEMAVLPGAPVRPTE